MADAASRADVSCRSSPASPLGEDGPAGDEEEEDVGSAPSQTEFSSSEEGGEEADEEEEEDGVVDPVFARDLDSEFAELVSQLQQSSSKKKVLEKRSSLLKLSLLTTGKSSSSLAKPSPSVPQTEAAEQSKLGSSSPPPRPPVLPSTSYPATSPATPPGKTALAKKSFLPPPKKTRPAASPVPKKDLQGKLEKEAPLRLLQDRRGGGKSATTTSPSPSRPSNLEVGKKLLPQGEPTKKLSLPLQHKARGRGGGGEENGKKFSSDAAAIRTRKASPPSFPRSPSSASPSPATAGKTARAGKASSAFPSKPLSLDFHKKKEHRGGVSSLPLQTEVPQLEKSKDDPREKTVKQSSSEPRRAPWESPEQLPAVGVLLPPGNLQRAAKRANFPLQPRDLRHTAQGYPASRRVVEEEEEGEEKAGFQESETEEESRQRMPGDEAYDALSDDDEGLLSRIDEGDEEAEAEDTPVPPLRPLDIVEAGSGFEEEEEEEKDFPGEESKARAHGGLGSFRYGEEEAPGGDSPAGATLRVQRGREGGVEAGEVEDDEEAAFAVEACGEGVIEGDVLLDEITPPFLQQEEEEEISSDSDIEELDHRWGMLASDYRWERQREQRRYRYTPLLIPSGTAAYVGAAGPSQSHRREAEGLATTTGIHAPPYRTLYRRPKDYEVGVTYLQHYQLPTVSRLLKTPAPEFIRKRPEEREPRTHPEEIARVCEIGGALRFEIELISKRRSKAPPQDSTAGTPERDDRDEREEEEEEKGGRSEWREDAKADDRRKKTRVKSRNNRRTSSATSPTATTPPPPRRGGKSNGRRAAPTPPPCPLPFRPGGGGGGGGQKGRSQSRGVRIRRDEEEADVRVRARLTTKRLW